MPTIHTQKEPPRGCGYWQPGGKYLVSASNVSMQPCGRLPIILEKCPTCSGGIKPSRGWTSIEPGPLLENAPCSFREPPALRTKMQLCLTCPMGEHSGPIMGTGPMKNPKGPMWIGKHGLLYIGEKFYPTPQDWTRESHEMGASRRLSAVPKDLVIGKSWVMVAHRKVSSYPCDSCEGSGLEPFGKGPDGTLKADTELKCETCKGEGKRWRAGIFHAFKPIALEYIVKGDEDDDKLFDLEKRGFRLVKVIEKKKENAA